MSMPPWATCCTSTPKNEPDLCYLGHRATGHRRGQRHGGGWEVVHVAVDDRFRLAYVEVLPDERGACLSLRGVSRHVPRPAPGASSHAPVYAADQRQGR